VSKEPNTSLRDWLVSGEIPRPADVEQARILALTAQAQGLAGILHSVLPPLTDGWTFTSRDELRKSYRTAFIRGNRQLESAARVQRLLEQKGLRALPLKGAALATTLYDSVAERPMADVDILALDDWETSVETLRAVGFEEVGRADHAWVFKDHVLDVVIELHHSLTSCPGFFPVDAAGLWSRRQSGASQVFPCAEDLLVHLALHACFQHGLVLSLIQWLDFRRLLERTPPNPERVLEIAGRAHAEFALRVSLEAARVVVGAPVPEVLGVAEHQPPALWELLEERLRNPLSLIQPAPPALFKVRFGLAAGRRMELIRGTLAPRIPGSHESLWHRGPRAIVRAGSLFRRWVRPA
jgi:hypothetical protein